MSHPPQLASPNVVRARSPSAFCWAWRSNPRAAERRLVVTGRRSIGRADCCTPADPAPAGSAVAMTSASLGSFFPRRT